MMQADSIECVASAKLLWVDFLLLSLPSLVIQSRSWQPTIWALKSSPCVFFAAARLLFSPGHLWLRTKVVACCYFPCWVLWYSFSLFLEASLVVGFWGSFQFYTWLWLIGITQETRGQMGCPHQRCSLLVWVAQQRAQLPSLCHPCQLFPLICFGWYHCDLVWLHRSRFPWVLTVQEVFLSSGWRSRFSSSTARGPSCLSLNSEVDSFWIWAWT